MRNWNAIPDPDKTWPNLKLNFKDDQTELKDIRGPTIQQAGYHHVKILTQQLRTTIDTQGAKMLAMLQDLAAIQDANPPVEASPPPAPAANAVA